MKSTLKNPVHLTAGMRHKLTLRPHFLVVRIHLPCESDPNLNFLSCLQKKELELVTKGEVSETVLLYLVTKADLIVFLL